MTVFTHPAFDQHEQVVFCTDTHAALQAIIAIHSTALGPACGGCRMWSYRTSEEALTDVLRLSQAMSYKNAVAGLPLGGGKAVILGDAHRDKSPALLQAFGRQVQRLGGRYYTAEDVGIGLADVRQLVSTCDFVFGLTADPSVYTARGVFEGMRAALAFQLGQTTFKGVRVAVQGVGNVGRHLCELLHGAGATLYVADVRPEAVFSAVEHFDAIPVAPDEIHTLEVEIFAPCALGGTINDQTLRDLKTLIVAGAANNQLASPRQGQVLHDLGILYAPDYAINAGGMLSAARDILPDYGEAEVRARVAGIYDTAMAIFTRAKAERRATHLIADDLARERIAAAQRQAVAEQVVA